MNKIWTGLLLLSLLLACVPDESKIMSETEPHYTEIAIEALLPESIGNNTRSASYLGNSMEGGLGNLDDTRYDLRFILEVFEKEGKSVAQYYLTTDLRGIPSARFNLRLLAGIYDFVFWTDFVKHSDQKTPQTIAVQSASGYTKNIENPYYHTSSLQNISLKEIESYTGNTDDKDAYTGILKDVDLTSSDGTLHNIKLRRPLGKVRVVTTDMRNNSHYTPENIDITYTGFFGTAFNAQTLQVEQTSKSVHYTSNRINQLSNDTAVLAWDYLFPTEGAHSVRVRTVGSDKSTEREIPHFPMTTNRITSLLGQVMTFGTTIQVTVDDRFDPAGSGGSSVIIPDPESGYPDSYEQDFSGLNNDTDKWLYSQQTNSSTFPQGWNVWVEGLYNDAIATDYHVGHTLSSRSLLDNMWQDYRLAIAWATPKLTLSETTSIVFSANTTDGMASEMHVWLMNEKEELVGTEARVELCNAGLDWELKTRFTLHAKDLLQGTGVRKGVYRIVLMHNNTRHVWNSVQVARIDIKP